jgi:hypothetical protein
VHVRQDEVRRPRAAQTSCARFGAKRPQAGTGIVNERHTKLLGDSAHIHLAIRGCRRLQRHAAIIMAGTFGFDGPAGAAFELTGVDVQTLEDHASLIVGHELWRHVPNVGMPWPSRRRGRF